MRKKTWLSLNANGLRCLLSTASKISCRESKMAKKLQQIQRCMEPLSLSSGQWLHERDDLIGSSRFLDCMRSKMSFGCTRRARIEPRGRLALIWQSQMRVCRIQSEEACVLVKYRATWRAFTKQCFLLKHHPS